MEEVRQSLGQHLVSKLGGGDIKKEREEASAIRLHLNNLPKETNETKVTDSILSFYREKGFDQLRNLGYGSYVITGKKEGRIVLTVSPRGSYREVLIISEMLP